MCFGSFFFGALLFATRTKHKNKGGSVLIRLIVAVGENGVIGEDNRIPWNIPADLHYFKKLTVGHTVIMGRKTFESIGHVLLDRKNIIVSSTLQPMNDAVVVPTLQAALQIAHSGEIFIIGGAQLYQEALPLADEIHLTRVHLSPEGDSYFPEVNWSQYDEVFRKEYDGSAEHVPDCTFFTYRKKY